MLACKEYTNFRRISNILFYISFYGYLIVYVLDMTTIHYDYPELYTLFVHISWGCVILSLINVLLFTDYNLIQKLIYIAITALLYMSYKNSNLNAFLQSWIIVLSARMTKWDKVAKYTLILNGVMIIVAFVLYQLGITHELQFNRADEMRICLGFRHPNFLGTHIMSEALLWIAVRFKKLNMIDYIIVGVMAIFIWIVPNSRTAAYIIILSMIMTMIMKLFGNQLVKKKVFQVLCLLVYPILFLFTFMISYFYDSNSAFFLELDSVLSNRLYLAHWYLQKYLHTWTGQKIVSVGTIKSMKTGKPYCMLDSAFMRLYISLGIIAMIIAFVMLIGIVWYSLKIDNRGILIGILSFAVFAIVQPQLLYLYRNFFLIAFAYIDIQWVKYRFILSCKILTS